VSPSNNHGRRLLELPAAHLRARGLGGGRGDTRGVDGQHHRSRQRLTQRRAAVAPAALRSGAGADAVHPSFALVASDNNYPFSDGRWIARDRPDDTELIVVRAPVLR
jgi:hypothetical protein